MRVCQRQLGFLVIKLSCCASVTFPAGESDSCGHCLSQTRRLILGIFVAVICWDIPVAVVSMPDNTSQSVICWLFLQQTSSTVSSSLSLLCGQVYSCFLCCWQRRWVNSEHVCVMCSWQAYMLMVHRQLLQRQCFKKLLEWPMNDLSHPTTRYHHYMSHNVTECIQVAGMCVSCVVEDSCKWCWHLSVCLSVASTLHT